LTQSRFGLVIRVDGQNLHLASMHGSDPAAVSLARQAWPQPLDQSTSVSALAIRERRVVNVADVQDMAQGEYSPEMQRVLAVAGWRSILCAPLMRDQDVVGTLCVGLFTTTDLSGTVLNTPFGTAEAGGPNAGLFFGGGTKQLIAQLVGVLMVGAYVVPVSAMFWLLIKATVGLRVSAQEEIEGLDIHEHGNEAYHGFVMVRNE
jgi:hypothetical protein